MGEPAVGDWFAGHRLEEVLGDDDVAVRFRGRRSADDEPVTVKIYRVGVGDDENLSLRLAGSRETPIRHPHLVRVLDTGEESGRLFVVTQYVEGPTLGEVIAERGRLDGALAAAIVAQVAGALDAAHEEGVVHRGVSCENISLDPDLARPHAYLSDLSLSRGGSRDRMTQVGVLFGLTPYAAPEVVTGVRELDGRADIYSLGCVLFESLAGRLPFPEANPLLGILARTSQPPPSVLEAAPGIDPRWEHVLATAMATGPGDRYGTAGELGRVAQEIAGT